MAGPTGRTTPRKMTVRRFVCANGKHLFTSAEKAEACGWCRRNEDKGIRAIPVAPRPNPDHNTIPQREYYDAQYAPKDF